MNYSFIGVKNNIYGKSFFQLSDLIPQLPENWNHYCACIVLQMYSLPILRM